MCGEMKEGKGGREIGTGMGGGRVKESEMDR